MSASIESHLPNPSLSFGDSNTGSDVLKMIEKFLNDRRDPVCGSKIYILVKRYPNETEIDGLVSKIRHRHSIISVNYSVEPSGGHHSETLYKLATKTNGFCAFDPNDQFSRNVLEVPSCFNPYLIYAANPQVSGKGSIILPRMIVPAEEKYWFAVTVQDQMPIDDSETVELSWSNFGSSGSLKVSSGKSPAGGFYNGGNYMTHFETIDQSSYSMSLNYEYSNNNMKTLQIRVYSKEPVNYWISYDN